MQHCTHAMFCLLSSCTWCICYVTWMVPVKIYCAGNAKSMQTLVLYFVLKTIRLATERKFCNWTWHCSKWVVHQKLFCMGQQWLQCFHISGASHPFRKSQAVHLVVSACNGTRTEHGRFSFVPLLCCSVVCGVLKKQVRAIIPMTNSLLFRQFRCIVVVNSLWTQVLMFCFSGCLMFRCLHPSCGFRAWRNSGMSGSWKYVNAFSLNQLNIEVLVCFLLFLSLSLFRILFILGIFGEVVMFGTQLVCIVVPLNFLMRSVKFLKQNIALPKKA